VSTNVQTDNLAQPARVESRCEFCRRPWFGSVAYCPYCGRKPGFLTIIPEPDDRLPIDEPSSAGPAMLLTPAGKQHGQKAESADKETRKTPLEGVPVLGALRPGEQKGPAQKGPAPPQSDRKASTLLFKTAIAGVGALLLFWILVKSPSTTTSEKSSPELPVSTSGTVSPRQSPPTSAAAVPSIPPRTDTAAAPPPTSAAAVPSIPPRTDTAAPPPPTSAAPVPSIAPRTDSAAPPQTNRKSLCSAAHEAAGLCKSQG